MLVWVVGFFLSNALAMLSGCAPIQEQTVVATPLAQKQTAGVGDVILRADTSESLPNVFGRADLYGRTRSTGYLTIQFAGMEGDKVMLVRSGVTTQSDASTVAPASTSVASAQPTIPFAVDWHKNPRVPAAGRTIVIEAATSSSGAATSAWLTFRAGATLAVNIRFDCGRDAAGAFQEIVACLTAPRALHSGYKPAS